jgi:hypothetical protein
MTAEEEYQKAKADFNEKVNDAKDRTIFELEVPGHIKRTFVRYAPEDSRLTESFNNYLNEIASDICNRIKKKYGKEALSFGPIDLSNIVMFKHCNVERHSDLDMGLNGPDHDTIVKLVLKCLKNEYCEE